MATWSRPIRRLRCLACAPRDPDASVGDQCSRCVPVSLDPGERLAALRREVDGESAPAAAIQSLPSRTAPTVPVAPPVITPILPAATAAPSSETSRATRVTDPRPLVPELAVPQEPSTDAPGWDLQELLADTSLSTWVGVGLLAIGGYLVLSWLVPGIDLIGSLILLAAGVVLLAQHFQRGAGAWALYAGAVLTGMGAARAVGDLLPGSPRGLTAVGVGLAFLAISYLRYSQAGGYGWQGVVGAAALILGGAQLLLGMLPGSPGILDLILPALLLIGGGVLIARTRGRAAPRS
jgi:hypothetical protein